MKAHSEVEICDACGSEFQLRTSGFDEEGLMLCPGCVRACDFKDEGCVAILPWPLTVALALITLILAMLLCGCIGTVTPDVVAAPHPSWVGDRQDSGIEVVKGVGEWSPDTRAFYNDLITRQGYGVRFSPPLVADEGVTPGAPNGWYYANHAARLALYKMSAWHRSAMHTTTTAGATK